MQSQRSFPRRRESRWGRTPPFGLTFDKLRTGSAPRIEALRRFRVGALVHCVRPRREFAPAGDQLSCVDKKVGKETTLPTRPSRCEGCLALLGHCGSGRTHYAACGRCVQTAARSQSLMRAVARSRKALRCSARPKGERNTRLGSLRIGWVACLCLHERGSVFVELCTPPVHCTPPPVRAEGIEAPLHATQTSSRCEARRRQGKFAKQTTALLLGPFRAVEQRRAWRERAQARINN
jgi:hypothetical protein